MLTAGLPAELLPGPAFAGPEAVVDVVVGAAAVARVVVVAAAGVVEARSAAVSHKL